jgi:phenylacetic acid degradation protein
VAAEAVVPIGFKVPERTLVGGIPAKILRLLDDADVARKSEGTRAYQDLAARSLRTMQRVAPLTAPEPNRKRLPSPSS